MYKFYSQEINELEQELLLLHSDLIDDITQEALEEVAIGTDAEDKNVANQSSSERKYSKNQ